MLKYKSSVEEEDIYIYNFKYSDTFSSKNEILEKKIKGEGKCIFHPIIEHFLGENIITVQTMVYF